MIDVSPPCFLYIPTKSFPFSYRTARSKFIPAANSCTRTRRQVISCTLHNRLSETQQTDDLHPVLSLLKQRLESGSKPGKRDDDHHFSLCIEGGGMRGAVAAGMAASIRYCGLRDVFDDIYGCSAGSIVATYLISDQVPLFGARIYYDNICSPHLHTPFISPRALISSILTTQQQQQHRPVLLLDRLIDDICTKTVNWDSFWTRSQLQPLYPVASSLIDQTSTILSYKQNDIQEFLQCLRASALVPGITGDSVFIKNKPYADGLLYEAIPFRSAIQNGASHVLVLRTRRHDDKTVATRPGIYEHVLAPKSLRRSNDIFDFDWHAVSNDLKNGHHISQYAKDVQLLQYSDQHGHMKIPSSSFSDDIKSKTASVLSVMPPPQPFHQPIGQLERKAPNIFHAVRDGFSAGYHMLSPFATESFQQSEKVAHFVFPDSELDRVLEKHEQKEQYFQRVRKRARNIAKVSASSFEDLQQHQQMNSSIIDHQSNRDVASRNISVAQWEYAVPFSQCMCARQKRQQHASKNSNKGVVM